MALVFLFIDGVGIGASTQNPLNRDHLRVLNFHEDNAAEYEAFGGHLKEIDACLGLSGLPQSATGQTSIFTGVNAAQKIERHLSGFPSPTLRTLLQGSSILGDLTAAGMKTVFANAFSPAYFLFPINRISASTLHMMYAGLKPRWVWQIADREALFQDYTNGMLIDAGFDIPRFTPEDAGETLAQMADTYDFVGYEYFLTDAAGHERIKESPEDIIDGLDRLLASLLETLDLARHTVLLCSDHGNIEAGEHTHHTRNPVPLITWGHQATQLSLGVSSISHIKHSITRFFGI